VTEPRITLASPDGNPAEVQSLVDTLRRPGRPPLNLFLALARHPDLLRDYLPFGSRLLLRGTLSGRDRELVILRTAWLCGCDYEWGHHLVIAARAGLSADEIADIPDPSAGRWTPHEAALLRAAGELVRDHTIGQAAWDTLGETYDDAALIEFAMLAGHYAMLAGLLNAAGVPREAGVEGFGPRPPRDG
jgi:4-carboxymuconolactone decarboxylase